MEFIIFKQLALSFLLGLLVGIQRERVGTRLAGMRTFPMISVFGTVCGFLATVYGTWILFAGMLSLTLVAVIPHLIYLVTYTAARVQRDDAPAPKTTLEDTSDRDLGVTTLMAILMMYAVGALMTVPNMMFEAVAVGGGIALLLYFKPELHGIAKRLADSDMRAIMQFVLITCIILPVLPNEKFGPAAYKVINPFESWLMVVLIVGMSLFGYIVYMFLGRDAGVLLGGVLGGSISSTATTVSACRQAAGNASYSSVAAITIMIASTVVFVRVMLETVVVCPDFFALCAPPLAIMMGSVLLPALVLWAWVRKEPASQMPEQKNPTQLRSAITFGLLYTLILFVMAVAQQKAGGMGMMVVAGLSGLTDMDAITLSTARMAAAELAEHGDAILKNPPVESLFHGGWRLLIVAALGNLFFKLGIIRMMADRTLFNRIAMLFAFPATAAVLLLLFW